MMKRHVIAIHNAVLFAGMFSVAGLMAIAMLCVSLSRTDGAGSNSIPALSTACVILALAIAASELILFLYQNRYYRGLKYGNAYHRVTTRLRRALLDAGYYEADFLGFAHPAAIELDFNGDLTTGTLRIRNSPHYDSSLETVNMASALGQYIVERWYLSDDQNWYIYEIYDYEVFQPLVLHCYADFWDYANLPDWYKLRIDERLNTKLQHMLIVGATRSGKTYMLYELILEMLQKPVHYELYLADPKRSSLWAVGNAIGAQHNAVTIEDIIVELDNFHSSMMNRSSELADLLKKQIDADYRTFELSPSIFIFDEFAAFMGALQTYPKATRDEVMADLRDIVLMGAQLGFFIIIVMQKSDASTLPTMLRDSLTLKVVLGNAEDTTYTTAFGTGVEIPKHNYRIGEGVYTDAGYANTPKLVTIPTLDFNLASAFELASHIARGACNDPRPINKDNHGKAECG